MTPLHNALRRPHDAKPKYKGVCLHHRLFSLDTMARGHRIERCFSCQVRPIAACL